MKKYLPSMIVIALVALAVGYTVTSATRTDYVPTSLTMMQSTEADGATVVTATLIDSNSSPVGNAPITFFRPGSCMGPTILGTINTNANGVALMNLGKVAEPKFEVGATFDGANNFKKSEAAIIIEQPSVLTSSGTTNPTDVRSSNSDESVPESDGSLITAKSPLLPTLFFALVVGFVLGWVWTRVRVRSQPAVNTV